MAGSKKRMRGWRLVWRLALGLLALLACAPTWGEANAEELGHHWEVPGYLSEIRLQLAAMAVLICLIATGMYIARLRARKGARS